MVVDTAHEFPDHGVAYLNSASVSRLPVSSVRAMNDFLVQYNRAGPDSRAASDMVGDLARRVRRAVSLVLRCRPEEVAFTQSVTDGINAVSGGMRFGPGSNLVIRDVAHEHRANSFPWLHLRDRVSLRTLPVDRDGFFDFDDLRAALDGDTALVALSHALYNTGSILPLEQIRGLLPPGALFFVDAAQTVGSLGDYDFGRLKCDFMAFNGSKWLCGPMGTGIFHCSRRAAAALEPVSVGPESVMVYDGSRVAVRDIPDRFEAGYRNFVGLAGLAASLEVLAGLGLDSIRRRNTMLADTLREGLAGVRGVTVYGPPDRRMGIVPFTVRGREPGEVVRRLEKKGMVLAVREIGPLKVVRAAPHFYNTEREMAAVVDAVKNL